MALNALYHEKILVKILANIYADATLGHLLGFKGGTAAYLFYELDRFSVDLDFDLLDSSREDFVMDRVQAILLQYGTIKEAEKKRWNLLFILAYDEKEKNAQNVKVEINRRDFGSQYDQRSYLGISIPVMTKEDMFAHKLMAMVERIGRSNRDIFDVWFFAKQQWPMNKRIIEERSGTDIKSFLERAIAELEGFDNRYILQGLGELLNDKQKAWVKTRLKEEALFLLKLELSTRKKV
ncbi:MAG: nucleotidyl transferase AbiEii/AbiGii toxin family protein [Patescibacteria group bacterium]